MFYGMLATTDYMPLSIFVMSPCLHPVHPLYSLWTSNGSYQSRRRKTRSKVGCQKRSTERVPLCTRHETIETFPMACTLKPISVGYN